MAEIYNRAPEDPNYNPGQLEVHDEVMEFIQQIEMTLFTRRREVIGYKMFGANLEDLIYSLNATNGEIQTLVHQQITRYCPLSSRIPFRVDCKFMRGTYRDIAVVDVIIDNTYVLGVVLN
jgi:hypothetical protein